MSIVTMPYKLQIFLPDDLRKTLKHLARQHDTSMQQFLVALLRTTTERLLKEDDPELQATIAHERRA